MAAMEGLRNALEFAQSDARKNRDASYAKEKELGAARELAVAEASRLHAVVEGLRRELVTKA